MTTFAQHILVATDFSDASLLAIDAASLLARSLGARLTLLHVFDSTPLVAAALPIPTVDLLGTTRETAVHLQTALEQLRQRRLADLPNVDVALVEHTSPAQGICEAATQLQADLVVVATHGRTGLAHLLIGSVAEQVVRLAPCPVLTLRSRKGG